MFNIMQITSIDRNYVFWSETDAWTSEKIKFY